jgi:hypothetical protein
VSGISVLVLARELLPFAAPASEGWAAERIEDRARELGVHVTVERGWRGWLTVPEDQAEALMVAAEAEQAARRPATGQAQPPDPATAAEVTRQGMLGPADCLAWRRASLAMAGATAQDFANAAARQEANGL